LDQEDPGPDSDPEAQAPLFPYEVGASTGSGSLAKHPAQPAANPVPIAGSKSMKEDGISARDFAVETDIRHESLDKFPEYSKFSHSECLNGSNLDSPNLYALFTFSTFQKQFERFKYRSSRALFSIHILHRSNNLNDSKADYANR
jgi:hypothetical protein